MTKTEVIEKLKVDAPIPGKLTVKAFVSLVKIYKIEIAIIAFAGIMVLLFIEAIVFFICKLVKRKKARTLAKANLYEEIEQIEAPEKNDEFENDSAEEVEEVSENNLSNNI